MPPGLCEEVNDKEAHLHGTDVHAEFLKHAAISLSIAFHGTGVAGKGASDLWAPRAPPPVILSQRQHPNNATRQDGSITSPNLCHH